jgi:phage/plasmid-like protein (TIGR03299 family)
MSHEVESMMYAGTRPWHGLGVSVASEVTSTNALQLAGLDWSVSLQPVVVGNPPWQTAMPGVRATVRDVDQKPLAVVGTRYQPVQNRDAFVFFDQIVGEGQAIYHTAGALDGGRRIWILAKLPGEVRIGAHKDITEKFLLLMNSHDGSSALRMLCTPIRVVCQNTLSLALAGNGEEGISIRHTAGATSRVDDARRALRIATWYYENFESEAERLLAAPFSDLQMRGLVDTLLPASAADVSKRMIRMRDSMFSLFENGRGHEAMRGTAWAALNAVAEYVDHHRPVRGVDSLAKSDRQLQSSWMGSGASLKRSAHALISAQV